MNSCRNCGGDAELLEDQHVKSNGVKGAPTFNAACTKCGNGIKFWSINKDYMVIKWNEENPVKVGCTVLEDAQFENIISLFTEKKVLLKEIERFNCCTERPGVLKLSMFPTTTLVIKYQNLFV